MSTFLHAASGNGTVTRNTANRHTGEPPVIAQIDVYNMPYILQAVNICNRSGEPLEGAHFALYRSVKVLGGEEKNYTPMTGYEDIVPGSDGIIVGIDNTLEPGKYYLTQNSPPDNYEGLDTDVVFIVNDNSTVTLESTEHCALRNSDSEYERAYFLDVLNDYIPSYAKLTVTKTVGGSVGDTSRDFTFTVSLKGAPDDESYEWSKNGETMETPLHSGDSFTIRHGESVTITVPRLILITVTEQSDGYETTFRLGDANEESIHSKTFKIDSDMTLGVVNTLEPAASSDDKPDSPPEETTSADDPDPKSPGTGEGLLCITVSIVLLILAVIGSLTILVIRFFGNEWSQEE